MNNEELIIAKFLSVKNADFIQTHRNGPTGIGKTFEDCMGVPENNLAAPDLIGYELKAQRRTASSFITLFTKKPTFPQDANTYLRNNFGTPKREYPNLKILHTSIKANTENTFKNLYTFKLNNNRAEQKITIEIRDIHTGQLLDNTTGYTYDDLRISTNQKLQKLFLVIADCRKINNVEEFHYLTADIYENFSFDNFLNCIDNGLIIFDIRIGTKPNGTTHDHGSGLRIRKNNIETLYASHTGPIE